MSATTYLVAVYEVGLGYGGPEEGGWWYDTGDLQRVVKVFKDKDRAWSYARRMNDHFQGRERFHGWRPVSSVAYAGGSYRARVYKDNAPTFYPEGRPRYE